MREYGIDVKGIFKMSWRRFRVYFDAIFSVNEEVEEEEDWNAALDRVSGRTAPTRTEKMDLATFQERYA